MAGVKLDPKQRRILFRSLDALSKTHSKPLVLAAMRRYLEAERERARAIKRIRAAQGELKQLYRKLRW